MDSLKPILLLIVLSGVGYGVYVALNHAPPADSAPVNSTPWNKAPAGNPTSSAKPPSPALPDAGANSIASPPRGPGVTSAASEPIKSSSPGDSSSTSGVAPAPTSGPSISLPFGIGAGPTQLGASAAQGNRPEAASPATTLAPNQRGGASAPPPPLASPSTADAMARHEFEAAMRTAESLIREGKLPEALRELSRWYDHPAVPLEEQPKLMSLLSQLAGTVVYSRQHWLASAYIVRQGETLESVAQQCEVPWQLLAKINGIGSGSSLQPGEEIKVVRGPFTAQLNLAQDRLALFVDGLYAGQFSVQGARTSMKPEGKYAVAKFAADDPNNITRRPYISLGGDLQLRVPDDAATQSPGSVLISPSDMADVFDMLSSRSEVTIRR